MRPILIPCQNICEYGCGTLWNRLKDVGEMVLYFEACRCETYFIRHVILVFGTTLRFSSYVRTFSIMG